MRSSRSLALLLALAFLATSPAGMAQTRQDDDYHFEDDDLLGDTLSTPPPLLQLRPKGRRIMLIRPRATFAAELIDSVERI